MTEPELWAARDEGGPRLHGRLRLFVGRPYEVHGVGAVGNAVCELPWQMLPSLAPGEKCRVRIVMDE